MSIATIASKKACTGSNSANTGKLGCLSLFGTPAHLLAFAKGTTVPAATEINDAYLRPLIQKGIIIPLIDASNFEDVSAEDAYSTNAKGIKRLNLKGLPEYKLTFEEGHEFYREMDKMESYKSYDYWIGDTDGNWMVVRRSDGDFKAFNAGHTTPELTKRQVEGGDPESKSIVVQFLTRLEWDRQYEILHAENLPFTPQEIPLINGVEIGFDSVPAGGATEIDITVKLAADRNTGVEGLLVADFAYTANGATVVPSAIVDNGEGSYKLTVDAIVSAQTLTIGTWHGATNSQTADSNGVLYRNVEVASEVAS
jgi:hypothetical protein